MSPGLQTFDQLVQFLDHFLVKGIIDPPAVSSIDEQAGILKCFQMEGQARLSGFQSICQIADTLLAVCQQLQKLESCLVRECMEQLDCPRSISYLELIHGSNISI